METQHLANIVDAAAKLAISKRAAILNKIFWAILVPLILALLAQAILRHVGANRFLEYKISHTELHDYLPQNLDAISKISVDGRLYSDLHIYTIRFWNRTAEDIGKIGVRIFIEGGNPKAVHKVLLRSSIYDPAWIQWVTTDNSSWDFVVDVTPVNWTDEPNYSIRLFVADEIKAPFEIVSNQAGIRFMKFADERQHWWLFGWDAIFYALGFWCAFGLMIYAMTKLSKYLMRKTVMNYIDMVVLTIEKNFPNLSRDERARMLVLSAYTFQYSVEKSLFRKKFVKGLDLPREDHTENKKPGQ